MSVFSKIKKILEREDVCVISKDNTPKFVAMKWDKWRDISDELSELKSIKETHSEIIEEDDSYTVDINDIPV